MQTCIYVSSELDVFHTSTAAYGTILSGIRHFISILIGTECIARAALWISLLVRNKCSASEFTINLATISRIAVVACSYA